MPTVDAIEFTMESDLSFSPKLSDSSKKRKMAQLRWSDAESRVADLRRELDATILESLALHDEFGAADEEFVQLAKKEELQLQRKFQDSLSKISKKTAEKEKVKAEKERLEAEGMRLDAELSQDHNGSSVLAEQLNFLKLAHVPPRVTQKGKCNPVDLYLLHPASMKYFQRPSYLLTRLLLLPYQRI